MELICIQCPRGCHLTIQENMEVTGNSCPRGKQYAIDEMTCPKRILTSTVKIKGSSINRVPVITSDAIPKDQMMNVMRELEKVTLQAPVHLHDIALQNVLNLGVDIVVTRSLEEEK